MRVTDQHFDIDYIFPVITPILATDAGEISSIYKDTRQTNPYHHVVGITTISGLTLDYGHVRPIDGLEVGQEVCRGQIIGYSVSGWWPSPFDTEYAYLVHVGFAPPGSRSYSDSIDPYPDLWTTTDYELVRLEYIDTN